MLDSVKSHFANIPGWRTKRKLVVFESDDWGMVRTSGIVAYTKLNGKYPLASCEYSKNDAVERRDDVTGLMEILTKNISQSGSIPKFTLNYVMFNPDFDKIKSDNFSSYHRKDVLDTYQHYPDSSGVMNLIMTGIEAGCFYPQFHATEHVNINNWILDLQSSQESTLEAFNFGMANLHARNDSSCPLEYLDSWGYRRTNQIEPLEETVRRGLVRFEEIFGFKSVSTIAPCYYWSDEFEIEASKFGVIFFQGGRVQKTPQSNGFSSKRHFMGEHGKRGQHYTIRNVSFERVNNPAIDWVDRCLHEIGIAFKWNKPAIISSHRVNYIGRLIEKNRDKGLQDLDQLLKRVNKRWPEVEYLDSAQLAYLIDSK
ncbi:hypothetical protein SanaruYs_08180 [Chryseotalea sanaruensis]|uniref:Polysaccharide deacetylase n=1 Tax=Chryseotalea sanaruensis TaxID=2482724 RepID=A0A401U6R7_9BACT|nr:hypothetical protein [Chryseotalea sanaruensis]GCC50603.1 hypothetical protein SanaruYs_08180 [Chryseotalea sanaruensis]